MFTVITKDNDVRQYTDIDSIERSVEGSFLAISNSSGSKVAFTEISPITWPTAATNGMQAIVDVKAGTLRFGYDWWPRAQTEFVVSEYVEDSDPVHVLDLIKEWPIDGTRPASANHQGVNAPHHAEGASRRKRRKPAVRPAVEFRHGYLLQVRREAMENALGSRRRLLRWLGLQTRRKQAYGMLRSTDVLGQRRWRCFRW